MGNAHNFLLGKIKRTYLIVFFLWFVGWILSLIEIGFINSSGVFLQNLGKSMLLVSLCIQVFTFMVENFGAGIRAINVYYYGGYILTAVAYLISYYPNIKEFLLFKPTNTFEMIFYFLGPALFTSVLKVNSGIALTISAFMYWLYLILTFLLIRRLFIWIFRR